MSDLESITSLLFSAKKLERDRGVTALQDYLNDSEPRNIEALESILIKTLESPDDSWEPKHGALLGSKALILNNKKGKNSSNFLDSLKDLCLKFLENTEVRIRLAAGDVLGSLCVAEGTQVYEDCSAIVLDLIKTNFERELDSDSESSTDTPEMLMTQRRRSADAAQIFHDTAGWKCLETSMKCLQYMIDGCGEKFKPYIQHDLLELLFRTLSHANRFVRETGYYVIGSLVSCGTTCSESVHNPFTAENFGHYLAQQIGVGLGDNWSQVRLAASEGGRKFLLSFKTEEEMEQFYPDLLPRMCLNRYYCADGVRIYSQESWKLVVNDNGRDLVKKYIDLFVDYYISQTKADNHAVREAACACIAELASKIDAEAVKPHVQGLLQTLIECFQDDSWPVRDAACLACGNFILCYPNESRAEMETLYKLFWNNLKDCIPSVRQGAAGAIANVVKAYGNEAFTKINQQITEGLNDVKNQPSESEKYGQMDKGPATFSVVKRLRDNDMELHTDKQMYSCGSLAPKMGRSSGGCCDRKFRRPNEPWELAEGCIHLIAELSQINEMTEEVEKFLPLIAEATRHRHYTHYVCLLESFCKRLPNIAKGLGKRPFKQYLDIFIDPVFDSLTSENILTSSTASQCLKQLSNFLGPNIFRSRIELFNPSYVPLLDSTLQEPEIQYPPTWK